MVENRLSVVDYSILGLLLAISSGIGVFYAWKDRSKQSSSGYLIGNRELGLLPVTMSLVATSLSSLHILGFTTEVYTQGTHIWYTAVAFSLAILFCTEILLPIMYPLQLISIYEYLEKRYQSAFLRKLASAAYTCTLFPYLATVLYGPSLTLYSVTGIAVTPCILVFGLICTLYTTIGGIKAVIWADVVQTIFIVGGLVAIVVKGSINLGGIDVAWRIAQEGNRIQFSNVYPDIYAPNTVWNVLFGMGILQMGNIGVGQMLFQRYNGLESLRKGKIAMYVSLVCLFFLISLICMCGVVIFANYSGCDPMKLGIIKTPDQLLPLFVIEALGSISGLPGLFVACIFSASLSTLSSGINALAASTWGDLVKPVFKVQEKYALCLSKLIATAYGLIVIGLAFLTGYLGSILRVAVTFAGSMYGPLSAIYVLGMFLPFCNKKGAIGGFVLGSLTCLFLIAGSVIDPAQSRSLPTSIDRCSNATVTSSSVLALRNVTEHGHNVIDVFQPRRGLQNLYQIHYLWFPVIGFVFTSLITILGSVITAGDTGKKVDPALLSPLAVMLIKTKNAVAPEKMHTTKL